MQEMSRGLGLVMLDCRCDRRDGFGRGCRRCAAPAGQRLARHDGGPLGRGRASGRARRPRRIRTDRMVSAQRRERLGRRDPRLSRGRIPTGPASTTCAARAKRRISEASDAQILAFYDNGVLAQTGTGALSRARALYADDRPGEAEATLALAWLTMRPERRRAHRFHRRPRPDAEPHHEARFDMTLWRGLRDAEQMAPLVSEDRRASPGRSA